MSEERKVSKNVIEVTDLSKAYGRVKALSGLTFSVAKGEIVGFLGPNGAGKSTTMRILCGMTGADSGDARVCGVDLEGGEGEVQNIFANRPQRSPYPGK